MVFHLGRILSKILSMAYKVFQDLPCGPPSTVSLHYLYVPCVPAKPSWFGSLVSKTVCVCLECPSFSFLNLSLIHLVSFHTFFRTWLRHHLLEEVRLNVISQSFHGPTEPSHSTYHTALRQPPCYLLASLQIKTTWNSLFIFSF